MAYKRRNYFINKEFQGKYIFNAFLLLGLGSILFTIIFSFFSSNTLSIVYENYHLKLGTTPGILLNKMLSSQWLFIVLGGLGITIITLFLTHRVAGPFFRFEKTLETMAMKDLSARITLRPKDEGKELALKINAFNEMLSTVLSKVRYNADQISRSSNVMGSVDDKTDFVSLNSELGNIRKSSRELIDILNEFKLTKE